MYEDHHLHGPREAESLLRARLYGATILTVKRCDFASCEITVTETTDEGGDLPGSL